MPFQGGLIELVTYLDATPENDGTAAGYLANAVPEGTPFVGVWGPTRTGPGLIVGIAVRRSAFRGAVVMLLSSVAPGRSDGRVPHHGRVVDDHLVHAGRPFGLGAIGAGRILGVDASLERFEFARTGRWLRLVLD